MFKTYFDNTQLMLMLAALLLLMASSIFHIRDREKFSIAFLLLAALCINLFGCLLDPFLNVWDERFHALVAQNMMDHPLLPTLYDDQIVNMAYDRWDRYYIWLHKQPLFMWQMALSFKIFGISEFTMRLPNALLGVAMVFATYRTGKQISSKRTGFIAAMLVISSFYLLQMLAGRQQLEQNDYAFVAYVSLSLWAFTEYVFGKRKLLWTVLSGIFAGMAVLCKWMPGLLVFLVWGVYNLQVYRFKIREYRHLLLSLLVACVIFVPWQLLCYYWYPNEFAFEMKLNSMHFTHAVDGQSGDFWFHFMHLQPMYGTLAVFAIIPGFMLLWKRESSRKYLVALFAATAFVFVFYSLAKTKMPSFTFLLALAMFIAIAEAINRILEFRFLKNMKPILRNAIFFVAIISIAIIRFDAEKLQENHTQWKDDNFLTPMALSNKAVFQSLQADPGTVLFNIPGRHYIEAMFYTGLPAYGFVPDSLQVADLIQRHRKIIVFSTPEQVLPSYLQNKPEVSIRFDNLYRFD